jgi:predicted secreted protein
MKDADIEYTVAANRPFRIVFNEAASGGYLWKLTENEAKLPMETTRFEQGKVEFETTPTKPGAYDLEFTHQRPWEKTALATMRVRLVVQPFLRLVK